MDDAKVFHEAVEDDGGRLDTGALDPATAGAFDYVARRARGFLQEAATALPAMPPIHFDFVDSYKFDAVAFRCEGRHFIGIHRGAVSTLLVLFDRMLADPEILPFIGDARAEAANLPLLPDVGLDFVRSVADVPEFPPPRDPARRAVAHKLAELALDFLTAHEFAHVANGHVDCLAEGAEGVSAIDEVSGAAWPPVPRRLALTMRTMEMDADDTAVQLSLASEWGKVSGHFPRSGPGWDWIYDRPGVVSLQWSWAVCSVFRLFGEARLTGGDATRETHPRPRLRSVMALRATGRVPRPYGLKTHPALVKDDPYNIPPTITVGQRDVEWIFSRLTGRPEASEELDKAWSEVGEAQMRGLQDYWRTSLREELLGYAYRPLSDYGDTDEEATREDL